MTPAIQISNLEYRWDNNLDPLLEIEELTFHSGEHYFIEGNSGSGKSTLLDLLSGVRTLKKGKIEVLNTSLSDLSQNEQDRFRSEHFGIIFQTLNLVPFLTVTENIALATDFSPAKKERVLQNEGNTNKAVERLLDTLKIPSSLWKLKSTDLSIGQQQRIAAARALIGSPEILIADEPTSALDDEATHLFMTLLLAEATKNKSTLIFVSHDKSLKSYFSHHLKMTSFKPVACKS